MKDTSRAKIIIEEMLSAAAPLFSRLDDLEEPDQVEAINALRLLLHNKSPFKDEPVDYVQWVLGSEVEANDYNPNIVAPPEMELLRCSIERDGYTQPIVAWKTETNHEVVDGFHRNRVGKECKKVRSRIKGYLPLAVLNQKSGSRQNRIAATIRHNRARGKHTVEGMSDIVLELKKRNWTDERISRELGMDQDEILRLCQITGLAELFTDQAFSKSWDVEGSVSENDFVPLTDDIEKYGQETLGFSTMNTSDPDRIFHTYTKWECYKAGFYKTTMDGMTQEECEEAYADFLSDSKRFADALKGVITEWKHSCEHYLTNIAMNRIAWLGQTAMCYATGIPATFRGGFVRLSEEEQREANQLAFQYLNKWLEANGRPLVTFDEAYSGRQSDIY